MAEIPDVPGLYRRIGKKAKNSPKRVKRVGEYRAVQNRSIRYKAIMMIQVTINGKEVYVEEVTEGRVAARMMQIKPWARREAGKLPYLVRVVRGSAVPKQKLSEKEIERAIEMRARGKTYIQIARSFSLHPETVSRIFKKLKP